MKRLPLAGAALSAVAGCYLAGCYWLLSTTDLTDGPADGSTGGVSSETGSDGGGASVDAQSDGGDAVPFCAPDAGPYVYCMDFDGIDAASLNLYAIQADAGIVNGIYVSPPSSLGVKLNGGWGTAGAYSVDFPSQYKPKTVQLEYQFMPQPLGSEVTSPGISLYVSSTQTWETVQVLVDPQGDFQVQEWFSTPDGGTGWPHLTFSLDGGTTVGAWHHVVLSLSVDDSQQRYFCGLTVDDQALELDVPLQGPWQQGTAHLGIGSTFAQEGGSDFYYDNVRAVIGF
jgi:hypothetical protein